MSDLRPVIYLTVGEVERFHAEIMQRAGQLPTPPRDRGLLESAVQRPQTAAYYDGADIIMQAAFYMTGIAANHPCVDGNKRTGFISGMGSSCASMVLRRVTHASTIQRWASGSKK
jgi:death-on-curing protein